MGRWLPDLGWRASPFFCKVVNTMESIWGWMGVRSGIFGVGMDSIEHRTLCYFYIFHLQAFVLSEDFL